MIPNGNDNLKADFTISTQPTLTYRLNFSGNPPSGKMTGIEAMKQAIFLTLHSERYKHAIYSWNYGTELSSLFGQANNAFLQAKLRKVISEALLQDDRILRVDNFVFEKKRNALHVAFLAETTQGDVESDFVWEG